MSQDTTYNGWTNYATWRVNLEIIDTNEGEFDPNQSAYTLGRQIEEWVTDLLDDAIPDTNHFGAVQIFKGYATSFMADVNWQEIAEHIIGDAEEEEED
jgi:hypothetical protein